MLVVVINHLCFAHIPIFMNISDISYNWLWLTLTNDTYTTLMPDMLSLNISYVLGFFIAIYIIQKFFLSLVLGKYVYI